MSWVRVYRRYRGGATTLCAHLELQCREAGARGIENAKIRQRGCYGNLSRRVLNGTPVKVEKYVGSICTLALTLQVTRLPPDRAVSRRHRSEACRLHSPGGRRGAGCSLALVHDAVSLFRPSPFSLRGALEQCAGETYALYCFSHTFNVFSSPFSLFAAKALLYNVRTTIV